MVAQPVDSVPAVYIPTGIRVGVDAITTGKNYWQDNFTGFEYVADVDFYRYFLVAEVGKWGKTITAQDRVYENDGRYFRIGADVNFLVNDPSRNVFFLGMRYARGNFSETLQHTETNPAWNDQIVVLTNNDIKSRWLELTGGLKVKIWEWLWLGYTGRFKFALKTSGEGQLIPYDVPGYGRTFNNSYWGFNYYLLMRLPVRKLPEVVKKE